MSTSNKAIILIIITSVCAGSAQLLWKKASFDLTSNILSLINIYLILGALLYIFATLLMTMALKEGELSVLFPLLSISYIWVTIVSTLIFPTESLSVNKMLSILLVFIGVSLVGIGGKKNHGN